MSVSDLDQKNVPDWACDAVWYQIFPERFRNGTQSSNPNPDDIQASNIPGWQIKKWTGDWYDLDPWETEYGGFGVSVLHRRYGGDLQGILDKLDYLTNLGINAIYLNPVFISPSHHKYDASSFHHIDPTLGPDPVGDKKLLYDAKETDDPATWIWTKADMLFLELIKEVHRREMKIIIDGVFNHSGRYFFAFQDLISKRQNSHYKDWYRIGEWDSDLDDGFDYTGWFGHGSLPEFREDENGFTPGYFKYLFNITSRWMAPNGKAEDGIDGWRLDVAFCIQHAFWKKWRKHVKGINPDAYITAELWEESPEYLQGDEFDALMNYPFAHSVVEFVIDKKDQISPAEFDQRLEFTLKSYPGQINRILQNLISSHDTPRLRTLVVNPDSRYRDYKRHYDYSKIALNHQYKIDRGSAMDKRIHKLVALIQMTYLGAPMIYYGDEVGMTGANDPDCRKPMLWDDLNEQYQDESVHPVPGYTKQAEKNVPDLELFDYYKRLIAIRHQYISLRRGTFKSFHIDNQSGIYGFIRQHKEESVMILINSSDSPWKVAPEIDHGIYHNLLENRPLAFDQFNMIEIGEKSGLILTKPTVGGF